MRPLNKVIVGAGIVTTFAGLFVAPEPGPNPVTRTERVYQVKTQMEQLDKYRGSFTPEQETEYRGLASEYAELRTDPDFPSMQRDYLWGEVCREFEGVAYHILSMVPGLAIFYWGLNRHGKDLRRKMEEEFNLFK